MNPTNWNCSSNQELSTIPSLKYNLWFSLKSFLTDPLCGDCPLIESWNIPVSVSMSRQKLIQERSQVRGTLLNLIQVLLLRSAQTNWSDQRPRDNHRDWCWSSSYRENNALELWLSLFWKLVKQTTNFAGKTGEMSGVAEESVVTFLFFNWNSRTLEQDKPLKYIIARNHKTMFLCW